MRFTELARAAYDRPSRSSGDALFRGDRVRLEGADGRGWQATVQVPGAGGDRDYYVIVGLARAGFRGSCPCSDDGEACAHQWAVLRELEALAAATERLGREAPCFRRDPVTGRVIGWRDAQAREQVLRPAAGGDPAPPWALRLDRLARPRHREHRTAAAATWLVDLRQSRSRDALAVLPVRYDAPPDAERPPSPLTHAADAAGLGDGDRAVLACLRGADDAHSLPGDPTGLRPFTVPTDLLPTLLPLLRRVGLHLWDNCPDGADLPRQRPLPIAWDLSPSYRFAAVHREADGEVRGELWRGAHSVRASDVLALFGAAGQGLVRTGPEGTPTVITVDCGRGEGLARSLLLDGPIVADPTDTPRLLAQLAEVPGADRLESAAIRWRDLAPAPVLQLVAPEDGATTPILAGEIRFGYGTAEVAADAPRTCVAVGDGAFAKRNEGAEADARRTFGAVGGIWLEAGVPAVPVERSGEILQRLLDRGWRVLVGPADVRAAGAPRLRARSGGRVDWFALEGAVPFGDHELPLPELLCTRAEPGLVPLPDGSLGLLPQPLARKLRALDACATRPGTLEFRGHQSWVLDALLATRPDLQLSQDDNVRAARERMAALDRPRTMAQPAGFGATLRDYQREGLGWMHYVGQLGLGACLADDMGLGKTVQVLAYIEQRRQERSRTAALGAPSLVVAPRSLVGNWQREAARFAPGLKVRVFTGPQRWRANDPGALLTSDLVLTTYGTLRHDAARLRDVGWDLVVLDEAQAIKNPRSQSSKAVRLLNARQRLALSGTPVENNLGELWALFEFLNPGMLGRNEGFQQLVQQVDADGDEGALRQLQGTLQPLMLRRTKDTVLHELPPKTEQVLMCPMGPTQERQYRELAAYYREQLLAGDDSAEGRRANSVQVLEGLLRLRQAACHPALLDPARGDEDCAKFEVLRPMLDELLGRGHKALVFSQFKSFLALLRRDLERDGIPHAYLDGATVDREACVQRFQEDPECGLFLISLRAGGTGLNLTAADYVFLLDPWWNPAAEDQAVDRAHRMGQTRPVMAYRLLCPGTVEEHVAQLQQRKRALADGILGTGSTRLKDLTTDDLRLLLDDC